MRPIISIAVIALLACGCDGVLPQRGAPQAEVPIADTPTPAVRPAASRRAPGPAVDERAAFTAVRGTLRRLVIAEETYFAENGTYTGDLDGIRFRPPTGVRVAVLWATRDGWAARGSHDGVPGKDCVVYVGAARPAPASRRQGRQAREGEPACDAASGRSAAPRSPAAPRPPEASPPAAPDTGSGLDQVSPIVQMKVDLRNLARSQEAWYKTQGAYSWRVEPFAMQFLWHRGVKLRILSADRDSWSARATHDALPGRSCVIWYGAVPTAPRTQGQRREAPRAAVPACDDPA